MVATPRDNDLLTEKIIGFAIEVHRQLGPGLLESAYEECLCFELKQNRLDVRRQVPLPVIYKSIRLDCGYRLDLVIENQIIIELKTVERLLPLHEAQLLTYMKLSGIRIGAVAEFQYRRCSKTASDGSCYRHLTASPPHRDSTSLEGRDMAENNLVRFENVDGIGVITIDNPPVNALSPGVPEGIVESVERGNADPAIRAMVLIGAGRSFIAGADIRTFGNRPPPVQGRRPHEILDASQKPVVAAIHGYALGGGFEIALASNYRIAVPSAKVGLPEVLIGILPGSGGTQRLPRLIGPKAALDMIVSGRHVPAEEAHRLGIIDELVPEGGDLRAGGDRLRPPRRRHPAIAAHPRP